MRILERDWKMLLSICLGVRRKQSCDCLRDKHFGQGGTAGEKALRWDHVYGLPRLARSLLQLDCKNNRVGRKYRMQSTIGHGREDGFYPPAAGSL